MVAAYLTQCGEVLPLERVIQCLLNMIGGFGSSQRTCHSDIGVNKYLVYHINDGLCVTPAEGLEGVGFIMVGE